MKKRQSSVRKKRSVKNGKAIKSRPVSAKSTTARRITPTRTRKAKARMIISEPYLDMQKIISDIKFSEESSNNGCSAHDLPYSYNKTMLILMVRDPYCIFGYWDYSGETWNQIQSLRQGNPSLTMILRIYDVTDVHFNGQNPNSYYDIPVTFDSKNWYVHVNQPNRDWIFDLALRDSNGNYHLIARSNRVKTPRDAPSDVIDEDWMVSDFDEIYELSGGSQFGLSSMDIKKIVKRRRFARSKKTFSSNELARPS